MSTSTITTDQAKTVLEDVLRRIENSDEWWMDEPDRGGFDADAIRGVLASLTASPSTTTTDGNPSGAPVDGGSVAHTQPVRVPGSDSAPLLRILDLTRYADSFRPFKASVTLDDTTINSLVDMALSVDVWGDTPEEAQQAAVDRWNQAFGSGLASEIARLREERDTATAEVERLREAIRVKGGTEHAPTEWAYERACDSSQQHRDEAGRLREALAAAQDALSGRDDESPMEAHARQIAAMRTIRAALTPSPSADPTDHA